MASTEVISRTIDLLPCFKRIDVCQDQLNLHRLTDRSSVGIMEFSDEAQSTFESWRQNPAERAPADFSASSAMSGASLNIRSEWSVGFWRQDSTVLTFSLFLSFVSRQKKESSVYPIKPSDKPALKIQSCLPLSHRSPCIKIFCSCVRNGSVPVSST